MLRDTESTARWLTYWRNSLADTESLKGTHLDTDFDKHHLSTERELLQHGRLEPRHVNYLFKGTDAQTHVVGISFSPWVFTRTRHHGFLSDASLPDIILPVTGRFWLHRNGYCLPAAMPLVPRDLLAPQANDSFTLAEVAQLDQLQSRLTLKVYADSEAASLLDTIEDETFCRLWQPCREAMQALFDTLAHKTLRHSQHYQDKGCASIQGNDDVSGAVRNIVSLYDWLAAHAPDTPLLDGFALRNNRTHAECLDPLSGVARRLGHSNSQFPLAEAQRAALAQTLDMKPGEILAVNGPPGTGKTTFVLSVVASLCVDAALKEDEPPLIVAASTNNQAVTNIIDAFGKDFEENEAPVSGHWLPEISSYGGYLPSKSKEPQAAKQYQTSAFYHDKETCRYVIAARADFLARAGEYFDCRFNAVEPVKQRLHQQLTERHQQLHQLQSGWDELQALRQQCERLLGKHPEAGLAQLQQRIDQDKTRLARMKGEYRKWQQFCAEESLWLSLFSFLPAVARKRALRRRLFIEQTFTPPLRETVHEATEDTLDTICHTRVQQHESSLQALLAQLERHQALLARLQQAEQAWQALLKTLVPGLERQDLAGVDAKLDTTLRFHLFQLAVHYWEARWLMECEAQLEELEKNRGRTGKKAVQPRWRRRMKLTPCIVSTLHSLPGHMQYSVFESKNSYSQHYLINEIDLLIIDEAGQVAPDVAGASFALAKRALVIGDTHQIKPINQLLPSVDCGNLVEAGLVGSVDGYNELIERDQGRNVTTGSVMRIAQQASEYRYLPNAEPGMFLREHRRCYDEIIQYCNDLCYRGLLLPKRGSSETDDPNDRVSPPALGFLHIDGCAEVSNSGSRINRLEAQTLAGWIADNRDILEQRYAHESLDLNGIIGVVTPFRAQADLIIEECQKLGIEAGRNSGALTVGTVHALQGAERKVVIFSQVYSRHADGPFIDSDPAILNVAVSRAKDSFLVFGDMDVMNNAAPGSPRRLLADLLDNRSDSELPYKQVARSDLVPGQTDPLVLNDAQEHDRFLFSALQQAQHQMDMVSPWVSLPCLQKSGLLNAMKATIERGVTLRLYTDSRFNTHENNRYSRTKADQFDTCCSTLSAVGVEVRVLHGIHSKLLMVDDCHLCIGSFNWASAARGGRFKNMETSIVYQGELKQEMDTQRAFLERKCQ